MKIIDVYEKYGIEYGGPINKLGSQMFIDSHTDHRYIFHKYGMIYEHTLKYKFGKRYQMNLRVSQEDRSSILIKGLARQMKFALPRILKRRMTCCGWA